MAARRCRICEDSQRTEIDARLLLGTPLRTVAKEFSLKRSTLGRHLQRHVKQAGEAALARATASYSRHLRQHMEKIQEQTLQIVTARSGIVLAPELRIEIANRACSATLCLAGNVALTIEILNVALGS